MLFLCEWDEINLYLYVKVAIKADSIPWEFWETIPEVRGVDIQTPNLVPEVEPLEESTNL